MKSPGILPSGGSTLTDYSALLHTKLGPARAEHSFLTAGAAVELAERYGADPQKAYAAGLLHDIMKDAAEAEQLQTMRNAGIGLEEWEKNSPKLWHAIAGAAFLKTALKIEDEDIVNAVRYHTTGRAGMSVLEKVIYIADYISPDRMYRDVETMRELAGKSLEDAMLYALRYTIGRLAESGKAIHPDSVNCYNEVLAAVDKHRVSE